MSWPQPPGLAMPSRDTGTTATRPSRSVGCVGSALRLAQPIGSVASHGRRLVLGPFLLESPEPARAPAVDQALLGRQLAIEGAGLSLPVVYVAAAHRDVVLLELAGLGVVDLR